MSLDKILESFNKKKNKRVRNKIYALLLLNEGTIYDVREGYESFYYHDPIVVDNCGIFIVEKGKLLQYDSKDERAYQIGVGLPDNWRYIVSDGVKLGFYKGTC
tara:strand:+ start:2241 stop:2549 length:309 start_codon:yes stop_codon:yes gene_type:complete